jgi:hypothetical protein
LDHLESSLAQVEEDGVEEACEGVPHLLEHCSKEVEYLRVSSIGIVVLIVIYQVLEGREELGVEDSELVGSLDVSLDQSEDVPSDSLHWLEHVIVSASSDQVGDALRVQAVDLEQVGEDPLEVGEVDVADTLSNSLVDLEDVINLLNDLGLTQCVHVLTGEVQDLRPVLMSVLHQVVN